MSTLMTKRYQTDQIQRSLKLEQYINELLRRFGEWNKSIFP